MKNLSFLPKSLTLLVLILLIGSCKNTTKESSNTSPAPAFDLEVVKAEIEAANQKYTERLAAGDSVGLSNLYTTDGKFMMPEAPSYEGRESITSVFSGILNSGISGIKLTTIEVWGNETFVTEEGAFELFSGEDKVDEGKYIVLWKKVDGEWHLLRDIFNSNLSHE
ncbi:Ketosteroid isomerase homolog [Zhouia amylolytica]|uniref:DUF4440 domain-containing protein n=2 Tax=Zhouia amylolytica TaxID=376730 RepID=W2UML3_9FLAO|nr:DUF4440 domain-containing protein [Zhouia amylolytica]ETN94706.1 hypothetical protein P278_26490 [Zhouia amylolytica AD3]MCQ0110888.1 DUF4440 domain-containing protein [Zhouia amylolytica]SFS75193.1 Ketosteroid isomerase homolog [Zhouia amylolytica]